MRSNKELLKLLYEQLIRCKQKRGIGGPSIESSLTPSHRSDSYPIYGLCHLVRRMEQHSLLGHSETFILEALVVAPLEFGHPHGPYRFPKGELAPRIEWLKEQIDLFENPQTIMQMTPDGQRPFYFLAEWDEGTHSCFARLEDYMEHSETRTRG